MNQLLDYFAKSHKTYLHARGEIATEYLMKLLDCQAGEKILEFGIGTGGTLVKMATRYVKTKFYGVDSSALMLDKAAKRLSFCNLFESVILQKTENNNLDIFADNSFDKIYVESVLGIQNDENLRKIMATFNRILKPSGKLLLNETIWLESTDTETIVTYNQFAKENFGIIQANEGYPYLKNWQSLLLDNQFEVLRIEEVDTLKPINQKFYFREILSKLFTLTGNIYGKLFLKRAFQQFNEATKANQPIRQLMTGYIIMASNSKNTSPKKNE